MGPRKIGLMKDRIQDALVKRGLDVKYFTPNQSGLLTKPTLLTKTPNSASKTKISFKEPTKFPLYKSTNTKKRSTTPTVVSKTTKTTTKTTPTFV